MIKIPKKWRELSVKEKLDLPVSYFKFNKGDIEQIRSIRDRRKRIVESARLQFNKFGDIHSFLVAWIAGYSSDAAPRLVFGSMRSLRRLFIKPQKNTRGIEMSWKDLQRGVRIPERMTSELAEETGIHLGDGSLANYHDKQGYFAFKYSITGDLRDEELYHEEFVAPLLKSIYGIMPIFLKRANKNSIETNINSKAVVQFKNKILGLPFGDKRDARISDIIFKNNEFAKKCLVGIFDTDFHITEALSMSGKLHSLDLAKQIHLILKRNEIDHIYRLYGTYARFYIPKKFTAVIVKQWGMHNLKHLSKFDVFEKFGVSILFSTTQERLDLLEGKVKLENLQAICNRRRLRKTTRPGLDSNQRPPD